MPMAAIYLHVNIWQYVPFSPGKPALPISPGFPGRPGIPGSPTGPWAPFSPGLPGGPGDPVNPGPLSPWYYKYTAHYLFIHFQCTCSIVQVLLCAVAIVFIWYELSFHSNAHRGIKISAQKLVKAFWSNWLLLSVLNCLYVYYRLFKLQRHKIYVKVPIKLTLALNGRQKC